jgi:hypothetical protein
MITKMGGGHFVDWCLTPTLALFQIWKLDKKFQ